MKSLLKYLAVALVIAGVANAGAIKTWTTEVLTYGDLNSNFEHIHNLMVGGHGARLVNADVSTSAAIAHSKLATPALVPKAMAFFTTAGAVCSANPCTLSQGSNVSVVNRTGAGAYVVTYTNALSAQQVPFAQPMETTLECRVTAFTTTTATISCYVPGGAATDARVHFMAFGS